MGKKGRRRPRARSRAASVRRPRKKARRPARATKPRSRKSPRAPAILSAAEPTAAVAEDLYSALPRLRSGPGVLVLHPWWGLNPFIRSLCDRLAREGFVVMAPDLYHGHVAATIADAESRMSALKWETVQSELHRAVDKLKSLSGTASIGIVGLSLGASHALWLACARPEEVSAVVTFYGTETMKYEDARAAFQCHFAAEDPYVPAGGRREFENHIRASGREVESYDYPGTKHWFFEEDRPDAYDEAAARLAWRRTLGFLRGHLSGRVVP